MKISTLTAPITKEYEVLRPIFLTKTFYLKSYVVTENPENDAKALLRATSSFDAMCADAREELLMQLNEIGGKCSADGLIGLHFDLKTNYLYDEGGAIHTVVTMTATGTFIRVA